MQDDISALESEIKNYIITTSTAAMFLARYKDIRIYIWLCQSEQKKEVFIQWRYTYTVDVTPNLLTSSVNQLHIYIFNLR